MEKIAEVGFCEHGEFAAHIDWDIIGAMRKDLEPLVKIGLEVDYIPGQEEAIAALTSGRDYDFIIGSVHFIEGWGFDHPDFKHHYADWDIDLLYEQYFALLQQAARSGLFDIMGHIDLIKIWGHRPEKKTLGDFVRPFLQVIKKYNLVVEINSAGLRKPVQEIYPSEEIIHELFRHDIAVCTGSDAHHPEQVGAGLRQVYEVLKRAGYRKTVSFHRRRIFTAALSR